MYNKLAFRAFSFFLALAVAVMACVDQPVEGPHAWQRSDMATAGLTRLVKYKLVGPASSESLFNQADNRGVNESAPILNASAIFKQMPGTKTQDVIIATEDGVNKFSLGMAKTKRFAGFSQYMKLEPATYWSVDNSGVGMCGAKVRVDIKKNFFQILSDAQAQKSKDYQALFYYTIPCKKVMGTYELDTVGAKLHALVINEVWQFRLFGESAIMNYGHSVTIIDGLPTALKGGWWQFWDIPDNPNDLLTQQDAMAAARMVNGIILDLETSQMPWLEFKAGGTLANSGATVIYSAGDADQYATFDRFFLNRQNEYVVFYRPDKQTPWDWIRVVPLYNLEWNDVWQNLQALYGWTMNSQLNANGTASATNNVVKELERVGWMNAPNAALDQVRWYDSKGNMIYSMTVRAHIGAKDTLVIFGRGYPDFTKRNVIQPKDTYVQPILHDANGNVLPEAQQPYTAAQWAEWQREVTFWDFLKDNPRSASGDLMMQYRFVDNSTWKEVFCRYYNDDGQPVDYVCGYEPVTWDLDASYYMDGDVRGPWLAIQTLGEVGVRTLGFSYASGLYEGTGVNFALANEVHRQEFLKGYDRNNPEVLWRFDARANQLPNTMAEAWAFLHKSNR